MKELISLGHDISYVESSSFINYIENEESKEIKKMINNIYLLEDTDDAVKLIQLAIAINKNHKLDGVICIAESSMESASAVAECLNLPFPSNQAVINCRNKYNTRQLIDQHGIRNVRFRHASSRDDLLKAASEIGFPLVIKPKTSLNSFGAAIIHKQSQLLPAWQQILSSVSEQKQKMQEQFLRGFLVEEYLDGDMVSVEVFNDGDKSHVFMISGRGRSQQDELIDYRIDMPANLSPQEKQQCEEYTLSIISAIGLKYGIFHIEVILTSNGPVLVEVNPRMMGSYMPMLYKNLTGNNIYEWLAAIHSGNKIDTSTILKNDSVGCAIRFDTALDSNYIPDEFKNAVLEDFSPVYSELSYDKTSQDISAGQTLGRVQVIYPSHKALLMSLDKFYKRISEELELELLH